MFREPGFGLEKVCWSLFGHSTGSEQQEGASIGNRIGDPPPPIPSTELTAQRRSRPISLWNEKHQCDPTRVPSGHFPVLRVN